ncbi:hypothetical protein [Thermotoga sp. SG1]|uniref:hypothetical protein n=1 Tax=Thermotoga sp. SG1 TaxID=126739 RepID=UPI001E3EE2BA|nr:hypothetical protein [Thermotoga sp. SG1]
MKRFFLLLVVALLLLTSCLPLPEEKHEFIVEVVGNTYLSNVMNWYQPSYSDYWLQEHPVLVLYYEDNTNSYNERQGFYEQSGDFVAAAGEIVDTSNLEDDLTNIWQSYTPIYDVDVWYQGDEGGWQARVRPPLNLLKTRCFWWNS